MQTIPFQRGDGGWIFRGALWIALIVSGAFSAAAQPAPKLTSSSTDWVQRGTTNEIIFNGDSLAGLTRFVFGGEPGLSAEMGAAPKVQPRIGLEATGANIFGNEIVSDSKRVGVALGVAADAPLGAREVRVVTPGGISNPLQINVSDLPQINEEGSNTNLEQAQKIELPAGISGRIGEMGQIDFFRFHASKGQRLLFDVDAFRSGSPLDSSLALLDGKGKELMRSEDVNGLDSLIDFSVTEEGDYVVALRDFRYQGGPNFKYHLTAGAVPYLDSIYPFGGQRGKPVELSLKGRNLGEMSTLKLRVDANAPLGFQEVRARTSTGYSNARMFEVSDFPEFMEREPNNSETNANRVELPTVINGRIDVEKDVDRYRFKVSQGQRFVFEVEASRYGSKLDALLTITGTNGVLVARNDDAAGADARIDQTFAEAGEYFVAVRDLLERGGDDFGYRLAIRPPAEASFGARVLSDTLRVNRGGRMTVRVEAIRTGFGGSIEITAEDLPKGIQAEPLLLTPDLAGGALQLVAAGDAEAGTFPLNLNATAVMNGKKISRPVQSLAPAQVAATARRPARNAPAGGGRPVKAAYLTVLEEAPFTVDWVTLSSQLEQNQSTTLQAEVQRRKGFSGDVKVSLEGFSAGADPITKSFEVQPVTLKDKSQRADFTAKAKLDSETGTRLVFVKAEATVDGQPVVQYGGGIPVTVTEFPFTLANSLPRLAVTAQPAGAKSAAGEAEFSVKVTRRGLFSEDIALALEGLPEGILATTTNLPRGIAEAAFKLTATEKAQANKTNSLTVVGTATVNGRTLQQRAPAISLVVNAPAEMETKPAAKPAPAGAPKETPTETK